MKRLLILVSFFLFGLTSITHAFQFVPFYVVDEHNFINSYQSLAIQQGVFLDTSLVKPSCEDYSYESSGLNLVQYCRYNFLKKSSSHQNIHPAYFLHGISFEKDDRNFITAIISSFSVNSSLVNRSDIADSIYFSSPMNVLRILHIDNTSILKFRNQLYSDIIRFLDSSDTHFERNYYFSHDDPNKSLVVFFDFDRNGDDLDIVYMFNLEKTDEELLL